MRIKTGTPTKIPTQRAMMVVVEVEATLGCGVVVVVEVVVVGGGVGVFVTNVVSEIIGIEY